jgi:hypothetical protein
VFSCLVCQRNKAQTGKKAGLLQPLSVPSLKWESVSMDFITQLSVTKSGYDAIAVFVPGQVNQDGSLCPDLLLGKRRSSSV